MKERQKSSHVLAETGFIQPCAEVIS